MKSTRRIARIDSETLDRVQRLAGSMQLPHWAVLAGAIDELLAKRPDQVDRIVRQAYARLRTPRRSAA